MGIVLRGPGIYVPPHTLTNKDLVELTDEATGQRVLDTSDEWIVKRSGIRERRIALGEEVRTLAIKAVRNLGEVLGEDLSDVEEIRFANNYHRDSEFPCYASSIAEELGLKKAIIHDDLAGCTGLIYAIRDAYNAINSGEINSAIVIGVEKLSDFTDYSDRTNCFLFGDGAGAYKLERRDGVEGIIANWLCGTPDIGDANWPRGFLTTRKGMGKKLKLTSQGWTTFDVEEKYLIMNGRKVFEFAKEAMQEAVEEVVKRAGYSLSDINCIEPHGANMNIVEVAEKGLRKEEINRIQREGSLLKAVRGLKRGPFKGVVYTNLERFGNTSGASIAISDREAIDRKVVKEGDLVVKVGFGAGLTYGAILHRATLD